MSGILLALVLSLVSGTPNPDHMTEGAPLGGCYSKTAADSIWLSVQPMSIYYDSGNDWFWMLGYPNQSMPAKVYTVDPSTGQVQDRFWPGDVCSSDYLGESCSFDEENNYLYITAQKGYNSEIWCIDVSDPDSPEFVSKWSMPYVTELFGVTHKDSYFYIPSEYDILVYSLIPGESPELINTIEMPFYSSGLYYDENLDVFYATVAMAPETIFKVCDGDDPSQVLYDWMVDDEIWHLSWGCPSKDGDGNIWKCDMDNYQLRMYEDEYDPSVLQPSSWGLIKTVF